MLRWENLENMINGISYNGLMLGDCLDILRDLYNSGKSEFIDLIYIDPPFNSKRDYNVLFKTPFISPEVAFRDTWSGVSYIDLLDEMHGIYPEFSNFHKFLETLNIPKSHISYLIHMGARCWYMRHMMKDTANFYYHCDPKMSHYIKIMLDFIFGGVNFCKNEIVWYYAGGGVPTNAFARKHDIILRYVKSENYKFNILYKPYQDSTLAVGKHSTLSGGKPLNNKGTPLTDYWYIPQPTGWSPENLGYPTQKPEALLETIISSSSDKEDLVADFYLGGGTTLAVADRLKRKWLGVDINFRAIQISSDRLKQTGNELGKDYSIDGLPKSAAELRKLIDDGNLSKYRFQDIILKYYMKNVKANEKKSRDNSIDGHFGFKYDGERFIGIVQVTTSANYNHFKAFCSEVGKETGCIGVYISFKDKITNGMRHGAKEYRKFGGVDKLQILTVEDIVDEGRDILLPAPTDRDVTDIEDYTRANSYELNIFNTDDKEELQEKVF
jgi:site-specific DNA-methyltransferase (adenine-specific)